MTEPHDALRTGDALLIVDVQKDFCPGGALPVDRGDAIVPVLNEWIAAAQNCRNSDRRFAGLAPTRARQL